MMGPKGHQVTPVSNLMYFQSDLTVIVGNSGNSRQSWSCRICRPTGEFQGLFIFNSFSTIFLLLRAQLDLWDHLDLQALKESVVNQDFLDCRELMESRSETEVSSEIMLLLQSSYFFRVFKDLGDHQD